MESLFIKTGLSPLYDIEMKINFCVFLELAHTIPELAQLCNEKVKNQFM